MVQFAYTKVAPKDVMRVHLNLSASNGAPIDGWSWVIFVGDDPDDSQKNAKESASGVVRKGKIDAVVPGTRDGICKLLLLPDLNHPEVCLTLVVKARGSFPNALSVAGASMMLNELGYDAGSNAVKDDPQFVAALKSFQSAELGLATPVATLDEPLSRKLLEAHAAIKTF